MFDIEYKGGNAVVITSKKAAIVVDPHLSLIGLKDISAKDAIVLATESRFLTNDHGARVLIDGPGEYEASDFTIRGVAATRHIDTPDQEKLSTMYRVVCGDSRIAILGNIEAKLDDEQLEEIGVIDILILPVGGGGYTLDATSAVAIVRAIGPKVVIPVHYADSGVKYEVPQDKLETFTSELGAPIEQATKYKVKSSGSMPQVLTVVELSRS